MRASEWPGWPCAIEVDGLVKAYGAVRALDGVSFQVQAGEIFGLLGANGAGKTTLLAALEGIRRADEGRATVLGGNPVAQGPQVKRHLGVQLQDPGLLPELTALEHIHLFSRLASLSLSEDEAYDWLDQVELSEEADRRPRQLSRGQQQRLAVALAFVGDPELILLDEPTAGLDPNGRAAVWEIIRQAQHEGRTVLLSTHELHEAEIHCDRVALLDRGRCCALGPPAELVRRSRAPAWITTTAALPRDRVMSVPGVIALQAENGRLRVATHQLAVTIAELVELAGAEGEHLDDLWVRQPGLEEVFVELTGTPVLGD